MDTQEHAAQHVKKVGTQLSAWIAAGFQTPVSDLTYHSHFEP